MKKYYQLSVVVIVLSFSNIFAQVPTYLPTNGLNAYYTFQGNALDQHTNSIDGTVNGPVLSSNREQLSNTSYSFDGVDDEIQLDDSFLGGQQVSEFTIYTRVYFDAINNGIGIWGKTKFWGEMGLVILSDGAIELIWANNTGGMNTYSEIYSDNNAVYNNTWYDIAVTFSNSSGTIFLNGEEINTNLRWTRQGGTILSTTNINEFANFSQDVGSSNFGFRTIGGQKVHFLDGKIDEFGIWDRALTQQEITKMYNANITNIYNAKTSIVSNNFKLFPNPNKGNFNIYFQNNFSGNLTLNIYDLNGVFIENIYNKYIKKGELNFTTDISNLKNGKYFIQVKLNNSIQYFSFVIER